MTLTTRLLVFFQSMLAVVLIGFSIALYLLANQFLNRQTNERLDAILNALTAAVEIGPEGVEWEPKGRYLNFELPIQTNQSVWFVADGEGTIVDRSRAAETEEFVAKTTPVGSVESGVVWKTGQWQAGYRSIHATMTEEHDDEIVDTSSDNRTGLSTLSITAGVSLGPVQNSLSQLAWWLLGLSVGIWCLALFLGQSLCRRALLPVTKMAVTAREMNASDLRKRLPEIHSHDELEDLNRSFNNLLDRLQQSFERQRRFAGDASHQLRTPLTAILGQIEVTLRRLRSLEEYQQILAKVHHKASQLNRIVESLLFLSRADSDEQALALERIDLNNWLKEHLQSWAEHERYNDFRLVCSTKRVCLVNAHSVLLGELLNILIDNSCKYSPSNSPIEILLQQEGNFACIEVSDQGHGIAVADLPHLFVPFGRLEDARQRGIEGVGLGLSIAKRLSDLFGGTLDVTSQPGIGTRVTLRLPLI